MRRFLWWAFSFGALASALLCLATIFFWGTGHVQGWRGEWRRFHSDWLGDSSYEVEISGGGIGFTDRISRDAITDPHLQEMERQVNQANAKQSQRATLRQDEGWNGYPQDVERTGRRWYFKWEPDWDPYGRATRGLLVFAFPCWSAALLFALVPAVWLVRFRRRRKRTGPPGLCPGCGYDLRATPEGGGALLDRCPECGTVSAKGRAA